MKLEVENGEDRLDWAARFAGHTQEALGAATTWNPTGDPHPAVTYLRSVDGAHDLELG